MAFLAACAPAASPTPTRTIPARRHSHARAVARPADPATHLDGDAHPHPAAPDGDAHAHPHANAARPGGGLRGLPRALGPDPEETLAYNGLAYFVWSDVPRGVSVRLVLARPREFRTLRADVHDRRNNGILIPLQSVPFSGTIDWQLLLIYEDTVLCRRSGQMQKAPPPLAHLFATPTPTPTLTPTASPSPEVTATAEATATPETPSETPTPDGAPAGAPVGAPTGDAETATPTPAE
ncbi:MAG: hypothetical protein M5R40_29385 [Anaerolineae bacterium]|nr:hypothetical protein [Anaerolineae bacterium]